MSAWVYILKSLKNGKYYIGSTSNLQDRINHHNSGATPFTRNNKPFILVFNQEYEDKTQALKIENWLKKSKSKKLIENIIEQKLIIKKFQ